MTKAKNMPKEFEIGGKKVKVSKLGPTAKKQLGNDYKVEVFDGREGGDSGEVTDVFYINEVDMDLIGLLVERC